MIIWTSSLSWKIRMSGNDGPPFPQGNGQLGLSSIAPIRPVMSSVLSRTLHSVPWSAWPLQASCLLTLLRTNEEGSKRMCAAASSQSWSCASLPNPASGDIMLELEPQWEVFTPWQLATAINHGFFPSPQNIGLLSLGNQHLINYIY